MKPPHLEEAEFVAFVKSRRLWSDEVEKAVVQAKTSHSGQVRDNGNPYLSEHIFPVAKDVIDSFGLQSVPQDMIVGALLHDCIEDDPRFTEAICRLDFGERVTELVAALTKSHEENASDIEDQALRQKKKHELNRKYIERVKRAGAEAIQIKMADRYNNLAAVSTIRTTKPAIYDRYVRETRELFLPLARSYSGYYYDRFVTLLNKLDLAGL